MSSDFTRQMLEQLLLPHFSKSDVQQRIHAYAHPYRELIAYYRCAMMHVETKFNILDEELSLEYDRNPIESIKTRLKSLESIVDKAIRKQVPLTVESIEQNLNDVAGVRVICSHPSDIYTLADAFLKQDDITLIEKKDYIANPKPNGYRSLHLIVETPIFLHDKKKMMKVEVQFRTISMDWWASLEHKIRYKKDVEITPEIAQELYDCAEMSAELDKRMETIQNTVFGDKEAMKNLTYSKRQKRFYLKEQSDLN
jgi:putative GTP pyrophosphokinase